MCSARKDMFERFKQIGMRQKWGGNVKSEVVMLACREYLLSGVGGWDVCLEVIECDKG